MLFFLFLLSLSVSVCVGTRAFSPTHLCVTTVTSFKAVVVKFVVKSSFNTNYLN